MSASVLCPRCGVGNQAGWTFCTNCGAALSAAPAPPPGGPPAAWPPGYGAPPPAVPAYPPTTPYPAYPGYPAYPPYSYGPPPWEAERRKQIDRTKAGILLLLIGALLSWIPYIGGIGGLFTLLGAILVIIGRKAFGTTHRRNVVVSIILFCAGIAVALVGAFAVVFVAVEGVTPGVTEAQLTALLVDAFTNLLIIVAAGTFIAGLASVFFTYALQKTEGHVVLWAAYGATVGVQIAILVATLPLVPAIAAQVAHQIVTTGTVDSAELSAAISGASTGLSLLNAIPALLYAAASYLAWTRINKGEIPAPPIAPTAAPPAPPTTPPINPV